MWRHRWHRQEGISALVIVTESLAVGTLSVGVDGEEFIKTGQPVEDDKAADAHGENSAIAWDGKDHRGLSFGLADLVT